MELQLVVPEWFRYPLIEAMHTTKYGGHIGWQRVLVKLQSKYYWTGMARDVQHFCEQCIPCIRNKDGGRRRHALEPIRAMAPFHLVGLDVLGPFSNESDRGNRYVVSFMDYYTKWPEAFATADHKASTVLKLLFEQVIPAHGVPRVIISDQAPEFLSEAWTSGTASVGAHVCYTSPYHHQANGLVERWNRTLMDMLRPLTELEPAKWDEFLGPALFAFRTTVHASTGNTPFFLMHGRDPTLPCENPLFRTAEEVYRTDYAELVSKRLTEAWAIAAEKNRKMQRHYKENYDRRAVNRNFRQGDLVIMLHRDKMSKNKFGEKFHPTFERLFRVVAVDGSRLNLARVGAPSKGAKWYNSMEFKHFLGFEEAYLDYESKLRARHPHSGQYVQDDDAQCGLCDGFFSHDVDRGVNRDWQECDFCLRWFHVDCIGRDPGETAWHCPDCVRVGRLDE